MLIFFTMKVILDKKFNQAIIEADSILELNLREITLLQLYSYYIELAPSHYASPLKIKQTLGLHYDASLRYSVSLIGKYTLFRISLACINPSEVNDNNYTEQEIALLFKRICHPALRRNRFIKKYFARAKHDYINDLLSLREEPEYLANVLAYENYFKPFGYNLMANGDLDLLKKLTIEDLESFYLEVLQKCQFNYYTNLNLSFPVNRIEPVKLYNNCLNREYSELILDYPFNEVYLHIFAEVDRTKVGRTALLVFNQILGGVNSILFQEIREKLGLCYAIHSSIKRSFSFIDIFVLTAKDKYLEVISKIKGIVKNPQIIREHFENTKNSILESSQLASDSLGFYFDEARMKDLDLDNIPFVKRQQALEKVTYEDVLKVAQAIKISFICGVGNCGSN